jgi:hypothetical protein
MRETRRTNLSSVKFMGHVKLFKTILKSENCVNIAGEDLCNGLLGGRGYALGYMKQYLF